MRYVWYLYCYVRRVIFQFFVLFVGEMTCVGPRYLLWSITNIYFTAFFVMLACT